MQRDCHIRGRLSIVLARREASTHTVGYLRENHNEKYLVTQSGN